MACFALLAVAGAVGVIQSVAAETVHGRLFPSFAGVTTVACNLFVLSLEGEFCFVMVIAGRSPALLLVTIRARLTQSPSMEIMFLMTVDTFGRRLPVLLLGFMAGRAGDLDVPPLEWKIRATVVEDLFAQ